MDQENTYIRSNTMEQNNTDQVDDTQTTEEQHNHGFYEWLKFIIFFAAILLITILVIRVIAPFIFTEYVPDIMGLSENDDSVVMPDSDHEEDDQEPMPADSSTDPDMSEAESENNAGLETESMNESVEEAVTEEAEAEVLPTEEVTSSKAEEPDSDPSTEAAYSIYIVRPGENLTSIAAAHQLTVKEIIEANELVNQTCLKQAKKYESLSKNLGKSVLII